MQLIDGVNQAGIFKPPVAEQLADVGPVLLLDMPVVIFLVGSGAGEGHGLFAVVPQVTDQVPVQELRTIIAVEAPERERKTRFYIPRGLHDGSFPFVPYGSHAGPARIDVRKGYTPDEVSGQRAAAMCHGVGLQPAGTGNIIVVGAYGDLIFKQPSRLGPTTPPPVILRFARGQKAVDLSRADRQQLPHEVPIQLPVALLIGGKPQGQQGFEAFPTGLLGLLPHYPEHGHNLFPIHGGPTLANLGITSPANPAAQQLNGMFTAISELLAYLIEHPGPPLGTTPQIPLTQTGQHLFSYFLTHWHPFRCRCHPF